MTHSHKKHTNKSNKKKVTIKVAKKAVKAGIKVGAAAALGGKIKGHGDYVPNRFNRVGGHGGYWADALGGVGRMVGGVGDLGHSIFKSITGMGDYQARAKNHQAVYTDQGIDGAFSAAFSNPQPMNMGAMNAKFGGSAPEVSHREFIGPVVGSKEFKTSVWRIQPGVRGAKSIMPWGSTVAGAFQQYELHGMIFEYVSTSTDFSSTTALGSVMMSTNYDAEAIPFASQREVNNAEFTTFNKPSMSFIHPIECASKDSPITVRYVAASNTITQANDSRFADVGTFQLSTIGQPVDGAEIGELWVTYKIRYLKPKEPDFHAGTSFLYNNKLLAFTNAPTGMLWGDQNGVDAKFNKNNSLPITLGAHPSQSFLSDIILPAGYAGNYQVTVIVSTNNDSGGDLSTFLNASALSLLADTVAGETDVRWLSFAAGGSNAATYTYYLNAEPSAIPYVTGSRLGSAASPGSKGRHCVVATGFFQTIAENPAKNRISVSFGPGKLGASTEPLWVMLCVTAVDNDITGHTQATSVSLQLEQLQAQMAELTKQNPQYGPGGLPPRERPSGEVYTTTDNSLCGLGASEPFASAAPAVSSASASEAEDEYGVEYIDRVRKEPKMTDSWIAAVKKVAKMQPL